MVLDYLKLQNYRCFENFEIKFNSKMNVIVGNNGVGKTSILDALSVAIGTFFSGIDGAATRGINKNDVYYKRYKMGSTDDIQRQYPACIYAEGNVEQQKLSWERSLKGEKGRTLFSNAKEMTQYAEQLQEKVREGDVNTLLPLFAYYGAGRLWMQKKEKKGSTELKQFTRFSGYIDCLDSASNEKMMLKWFEKMTLLELQNQNQIPELQVVKKAIVYCFKNAMEVEAAEVSFDIASHSLELKYEDSYGEWHKHPLNDLSDGYRNTLSLIADIAFRMALLNPQCLEHVLDMTEGIVLIDEIDLHLHPKWQQRIISDLQTIFPKVQFIVTTHAPAVIQSVKKESLITLENGSANFANHAVYGRDVNSILREIMGVSERPVMVKNLFQEFYDFIDIGDLDHAKKALNRIYSIVGDTDPEYISAKVTLDLEE